MVGPAISLAAQENINAQIQGALANGGRECDA